jgi:hypothetical protein
MRHTESDPTLLPHPNHWYGGCENPLSIHTIGFSMMRNLLIGLAVFFGSTSSQATEICELIMNPFTRDIGETYYVAYCTDELETSLYEGSFIEYSATRHQYSASNRAFLRKLILDHGYELLTMHENLEIYKKSPKNENE